MKTASPALISLLATATKVVMADLYTITLIGGTQLRYTNYDLALVVGGLTFYPGGSILERETIRTVRGVEVDSLTLTIYASETHTVLGVPMMQAVASGMFDGARILLRRLYMATPGDTSIDPVILFKGRVSETSNSRSKAELVVASDLELLNVQFPRILYQASCTNTLFDTACSLTKSAWGVGTSVNSGSTKTRLLCSLTPAAGYFSGGTITFSSGPNSSVTRTIKNYSPGIIDLAYPLQYQPAVGDTFTAYPGCDKTVATCSSRFNNKANFKGFPFVPMPETGL